MRLKYLLFYQDHSIADADTISDESETDPNSIQDIVDISADDTPSQTEYETEGVSESTEAAAENEVDDGNREDQSEPKQELSADEIRGEVVSMSTHCDMFTVNLGNHFQVRDLFRLISLNSHPL